MGKFTPCKGSNECLSCGSNDGRCKSFDPWLFCMSDVINPPQGYRFVGRSSNGSWNKYAPGDDHPDPQTRETWRLQAETIKREHERQEAIKRSRALSVQQRHELFSKLLAELRLHPEDRADLHRRGLTDSQIQEWGVVSVVPWQKLKSTYPKNLAGIGRDGQSLQTSGDGYAWPIHNADGLIVGIQYRLRNPSDGGRFRWFAGEGRHHLPNGETPLSIFGESSDRVYLVEGTGVKPLIASHRLGGLIVGASGGQFASSPEQLKAVCDGRSPFLVPDSGSPFNRNIMGQYRRLAAELPNLQVMWWGQWDKGLDIDDVDLLRLMSAQILSWAEFEAIAKLEAYRRKSEEIKRALCSLTREPDERRNERYLSTIHLPVPGTITAVSSPCNTAKTTQLKGIVAQHRELYSSAKEFMIGYRNGLLRQTGSDKQDKETGKVKGLAIALVHDLDRQGIKISLKNAMRVALCVDSILRINLEDIPKNSLIILDEVDATLKHLLMGGTLRDKHAEVMQHFRAVLRTVLERNGSIIALEDGLNDLPLQFLEDATGVRPYLILNEHQADQWKVVLGKSGSSGFVKEILNSLKNGDRLCVACTSQEFAEKLEMVALRAMPELKVLRVDSETAETPWVKTFQEDPDEYLFQHQIQLLIYTPTMESGVSIEKYDFNAVYGYFVHLEDRAQFQLLNRYRKPVPRNILCSEFASADDGHGCNPETVIKDWEMASRRTAAIAQVKASLDQDLADEPSSDRALQRVEAFKKLSNEDAKFWNTWIARYQARANGSQARMCDRLAEVLRARGHHVSITGGWGICKGTAAELREAKQTIHQRKASALADADPKDMTVDEAYQILNNPTSNKADRLAARKRLLQERLPGDALDAQFLQDVVISERSRFLRSTTLLWLTEHPEVAAHIDRQSFKSQLDKPFIVHKRLTHYRAKTETLVLTGIKALTDGREYREDDELVQEIKRNALKARHDIWRFLGLNVNEGQTAITICNKLLKKLGFKAEDLRQEGPRGKRVRIYSVRPTDEMKADPNFIDWDSYRQRIFAAQELKYAEFLKPAQQEEPSPVHTISNSTLVSNKIVCTDSETLPDPLLLEIKEARQMLAIASDPETRALILSYLSPQAREAIAS